MAIDKREDAGEFYPGGKVVPRTPVTPGGGGGDMYHSEFGDLDPETTPLAVVIERLKGTVNTIAAAICLIGSISACAAVSVVPVYTNHNRVAGNVQTMTNMPAWASAVETAIGEIGGVTTNAVIDIVSPMTNAAVEAAVGCATNAAKAYADGTFLKTSGGTVSNGFYVALDSDYYPYKSALINPSTIAVWKDINHDTLPDAAFYLPGNTEHGGYILTDEYAKHIFPIVTNAYTKGEIDCKFLPKDNIQNLTVYGVLNLPYTSSAIHISSDGLIKFGENTIESAGEFFYFRTKVSDEIKTATLIPDKTPILTANLATNLFVNKSMIAGTDPTFSNAVMNVTMNVSSNEVAAIRAMVGNIGDLPIEGGAATIGGLLAALAAAVAWLKRETLKKGLSEQGEPTDPNVLSLFSGANTSLVAVCQQYGGTQIKQDEQGNYYYDVED